MKNQFNRTVRHLLIYEIPAILENARKMPNLKANTLAEYLCAGFLSTEKSTYEDLFFHKDSQDYLIGHYSEMAEAIRSYEETVLDGQPVLLFDFMEQPKVLLDGLFLEEAKRLCRACFGKKKITVDETSMKKLLVFLKKE